MIHVLAVPVKSLRNAAEETEAGDKHVCVCIFDKVGAEFNGPEDGGYI